MKHLNIEQAEAVKVIIDFDLCKFYAYLEIESGSKIVFATRYTFNEMKSVEEFRKYANDWNLPVVFSSNAKQMIAKE